MLSLTFGEMCLTIKTNLPTEIDNFLHNYLNVINQPDNTTGYYAIHKIASKVTTSTLDHLIEKHKLNLHNTTHSGISFIHSLAQANRDDLLPYALAKGLKIDALTQYGENAVFFAANQGHNAMISHLDQHYKLNVCTTSSKGETALHAAAAGGQNETIKFLVEDYKLDPKIKNFEGYSVLHFAALNKKTNTISFLHNNYKLDLYDLDQNGQTIFHIAASGGDINTLTLIRNYNLSVKGLGLEDIIMLAAQNGQKEVISFLIKEFSLNPKSIKTDNGWNLYHHAVKGGHIKTIIFTIKELGLDPHATTLDRESGLHIAASAGYNEVISLLKNDTPFKLNPDIISTKGHNYIDCAALNSQENTLIYLSAKEGVLLSNYIKSLHESASQNGADDEPLLDQFSPLSISPASQHILGITEETRGQKNEAEPSFKNSHLFGSCSASNYLMSPVEDIRQPEQRGSFVPNSRIKNSNFISHHPDLQR